MTVVTLVFELHRPTLTEAYHGEQWMYPQEES